ncbi:hypothetical protein [Streptomyces caelestis]|uniref:Uncharacterized protein n=1 Tax=Streptomyces caelestis TaxID=36816 RepID=A0A7W9LVB9_9ACTN|nr:hypothetical protein [Streptomyces caelestis]MBB5797292.1 hypothetical protein [Streptomyces caelestis]GGW37139.1 hypothetical protein GCM10010320_15860 [Streptomyces caelestis]
MRRIDTSAHAANRLTGTLGVEDPRGHAVLGRHPDGAAGRGACVGARGVLTGAGPVREIPGIGTGKTSLVLTVGRVTDPKPFPEDEDVYARDTSGN